MTARTSLPLLALPLAGRHLLEASAGTGKTWTISGLYLRLLLEAGLTVDAILVVTFTNAATAELKQRIRSRLRQALAVLDAEVPADDPLLAWVAGEWRDGPRLHLARHRLRCALARFDDAAIYTIHGFCQRVLAENPLSFGLHGDEELGGGLEELARQAFDDYWRSHCADAAPEWLAMLHWCGIGADSLYQRLRGRLGDARTECIPDASEFDAMRSQWHAGLDALRRLWAEEEAAIRALADHASLTAGARKKWPARLDELDDWLRRDGPAPKNLAAYGQRELLKGRSKRGGAPLPLPTHRFFERIDALAPVAKQAFTKSRFEPLLLSHALSWAGDRYQRLKAEAGLLGYDDLLRRVDDALVADGGDTLATMLCRRFPAALIDEFQDTDPVQYRIFDRIYRDRARLLVFVGDPKQAIYAFRGGDIFAYMRARDSVDGSETLTANYRSTPAMIAAVNSLFDTGVHPRPFFYPEIGYREIRAGAAPANELVDPALSAPVVVWDWQAEGSVVPDRDRLVDACVEATAAEIGRLLRHARIGARAVRPADIAVLVPTHWQGALVEAALQRVLVPCVRSGQDNVFDSPEAQELEILLHALAVPARGEWVRAALGTRLLGMDATAIAVLDQDASEWERLLDVFERLHRRWLETGFLGALQGCLDAFGVVERLLAGAGGERAVTNLLQLGELAHVASIEQELAPERLLEWLAEQRREESEMAVDAHQLRLESDAERVRILTVHKSKGLEFNICFAPFQFARGKPRGARPLVYHRDDADRGTVMDFAPEPSARSLAADEHLAEGLRLEYVALTRAVYRCYLAWGPHRDAGTRPFAWLLYGQDFVDAAEPRVACAQALADDLEHDGARFEAGFAAWVGRSAGAVARLALAGDGAEPVAPELADGSAAELQRREFRRVLRPGWQLSSYSAIVAHSDPELPDYDAHSAEPADPAAEPESVLLGLPGGVEIGTAVHKIFEFCRLEDRGQQRDQLVREQLQRYLNLDDRASGQWQGALTEMLDRVLAMPLEQAGIALESLAATQYVSEMGFTCSLDGFDAGALSRLLAAHPAYAAAGFDRAAEQLGHYPLATFLNGEIDLCFEAGGRYYIVDWKTNRLGGAFADYRPQCLLHCMRQHHYYLQYLLYTLALHRHLASSLSGYDYERHFGGVYYLFVRGINGDGRNGVYFDRPPMQLIEQLDRGGRRDG